jgi:hypothetical protein
MAGPLKMRQPVKLKCRTCGFDGNPADAKRCMVCDELLGSIVLRSASLLSDSLINWLYRQPEESISGKLKCRTCGFDGNPADAKRCMVCDKLLGSIVLRSLKSESLLSDLLTNWLHRQPEEFISGVVALEQEKRIQRAKNTKGGLELKFELSYYFVDAIHTVLKIKLKKVLERII